MKIQPYLTLIQGQKNTGPRRTDRAESRADPSPVADLSAGQFRDLVEVVSTENLRASSPSPLKDLGEAEKILARVTEDLGGMSRSELRNLHRLDGLVQYFRS